MHGEECNDIFEAILDQAVPRCLTNWQKTQEEAQLRSVKPGPCQQNGPGIQRPICRKENLLLNAMKCVVVCYAVLLRELVTDALAKWRTAKSINVHCAFILINILYFSPNPTCHIFKGVILSMWMTVIPFQVIIQNPIKILTFHI